MNNNLNSFSSNGSSRQKKAIESTAGIVVFSLSCIALFLLALIIFGLCTVTVKENEYVLIQRFGKYVQVYDTAGIKFKAPFIDSTSTLSKSLKRYDVLPTEILTREKDTMIVSSYSIYQISDPITYVTKSEDIEKWLDMAVYNGIKTTLSALSKDEINAIRGDEMNDTLTLAIREQGEYYGIYVADLKLKRFDLPDENKTAAYKRMVSERNQLAAKYEAEGQEEADKIRNQADKDKSFLLSAADADSARIIAEGEAEYMRILSQAYGSEDRQEFYEFIRSLDALKIAMTGKDKTIILPIDSPLAKWFVTR